MSNRGTNNAALRKARGFRGSVALSASSLLVISFALMGASVPLALGDEGDQAVALPTETAVLAAEPVDDETSEASASSEVASATETTESAEVDPSEVDQTPDTETTMQSPGPDKTAASPSSANTSGQPVKPKKESTDTGIVPMSVPEPVGNSAVITVKVGGHRTGLQTVGDLSGVRLGLYANAGDTTPVSGFTSTCTSDANGDCSFTVPETQGRDSWWSYQCLGANCDRQFWVKQISAPATYYANPTLGTGSGADAYRFQTGKQLRSGQIYRSTSDFVKVSSGGGYRVSSGVWQNSLVNPSFPQQCGINVGIVLDLSNSVSANDLGQMKLAANGFVDALTGTPSKIGTFTFATEGPARSGDTLDPVSVSSAAGAATVKNKVNTYALPGGGAGGTNWDRGFYQVVQSSSDFDVVVIITDGSPTYYGDAAGPGSYTRFAELENGIFSANAIKKSGTRVIGFGVGSGVSDAAAGLNLRSISGPTLNSDYYQSADYAAAGKQLRDLALGNCNGSISIVKQVIPAGGTLDDAAPAGGWAFTGVGAAGVSLELPVTRTTAVDTGAANFPLTFAGGTTSGAVTLTESPKSGFTLEQVQGRNAVCQRVDTGASITPVNVKNGFTVNASRAYPISCTVYNRTLQPAKLTLKKVVENGTTGAMFGPEDWTLTAAGATPISGVGNSSAVTKQNVDIGTYTLSESNGPEEYTAGNWRCTAGRLSGDTLTLAHGDDATCTIINTAKPATLTLVKTVTNDNGGTALPTDWTLTATGPSTGVSGVTGSAAVTKTTVKVGDYVLSESDGPDGYAPGPWGCTDGTVVDSTVTIGLGQDVVCTINNDDQASFIIEKWGVSESGTKGPVDGSEFEVRQDTDGSPGELTGAVAPIAGEPGRFDASPFAPGSYWLLETKAPAGHSLLAQPVGFTIADDGTLAIASGNPQAKVTDPDPATLTIRITDVAALPLPLSGGPVTNATALGLMVLTIGGLGAVFIRRQRRAATLS